MHEVSSVTGNHFHEWLLAIKLCDRDCIVYFICNIIYKLCRCALTMYFIALLQLFRKPPDDKKVVVDWVCEYNVNMLRNRPHFATHKYVQCSFQICQQFHTNNNLYWNLIMEGFNH